MSTIQRDKVTMVSSVASCTFNDPSDLGAWPGAYFMSIDDLPQWKDTVDLNVISTPRGVGDGSYTASRFPARARILTVAGYMQAPNRATLDQLYDLLALNAFPQDVDITLTRHEPVPKFVTCRLAGPIEEIQYLPAEGAMRWETTLLCSDPFKYDALNTLFGSSGIAGLSLSGRVYPRVYPLLYSSIASGTANQVTLNNLGTARTYPIITINGPVASGWRIENSTTGEEQAFDLDLNAGDILIIDNQTKSATLNGSPVNGLLVGDWFSLASGINIIRLFADYNGTGSFTVSARSRWR